jgi:hypothetical protein
MHFLITSGSLKPSLEVWDRSLAFNGCATVSDYFENGQSVAHAREKRVRLQALLVKPPAPAMLNVGATIFRNLDCPRKTYPSFANEFGEIGTSVGSLCCSIDVGLFLQCRERKSGGNHATVFIQHFVHLAVEQDAPVKAHVNFASFRCGHRYVSGAVVSQGVIPTLDAGGGY